MAPAGTVGPAGGGGVFVAVTVTTDADVAVLDGGRSFAAAMQNEVSTGRPPQSFSAEGFCASCQFRASCGSTGERERVARRGRTHRKKSFSDTPEEFLNLIARQLSVAVNPPSTVACRIRIERIVRYRILLTAGNLGCSVVGQRTGDGSEHADSQRQMHHVGRVRSQLDERTAQEIIV